MLKYTALLVVFTALFSSCQQQSAETKDQQKIEAGEAEWRPLFDGETLDGWIPKINGFEAGENYANTFRAKDGKIIVDYSGYENGFQNRFGHLFYEEPFSSYHLKFSYHFIDRWMEDAPDWTNRNSGVMIHSQSPASVLKNQDWPISVEFQLLAEQQEGVERPTGNMCSPGTNVVFPDNPEPAHCVNSGSDTYKIDEWVSGEIIVYKDSLITHLVDGDTVLQYTKPSIGGGVVSGYDPEVKIDGKALTEGYIGLQSEGQEIEFKDILIKEL